jgi:segregation and condensation protein B
VTDPEDRFLAEPTDPSVDKAPHPEMDESPNENPPSANFYDAALAASQRWSDPDQPTGLTPNPDESADPHAAMSTPGPAPTAADITISFPEAALTPEALDPTPPDPLREDPPPNELAGTRAAPAADARDEQPAFSAPSDPGPEPTAIQTPEVGAPEVGAPEVGAPEVGAPEVGAPEVGAPEVGAPEVGAPEVGAPEVEARGVEARGVEARGVEARGVEARGVEAPEAEGRGVGAAGVGAAEAEAPEAEAPEVGLFFGGDAGDESYGAAAPATAGPVAEIGDVALTGRDGLGPEPALPEGRVPATEAAGVVDDASLDRGVIDEPEGGVDDPEAPSLSAGESDEDGPRDELPAQPGTVARAATDSHGVEVPHDAEPIEAHAPATNSYVDSDRVGPDATVADGAVLDADISVPSEIDGAGAVPGLSAGESLSEDAGPVEGGLASDLWGVASGSEHAAVNGLEVEGSAEAAGEPEELDSPERLRAVVEAILLVVDTPTEAVLIAQVLERPVGEIEAALGDLRAEYDAGGRGMDLREVAGGWRLYTREDFAGYIERFVLEGQRTRLTQAALETLAVIAYRQPITRSRVSAIRGVNVDAVMRTLLTRGLVEECGSDTDTGGGLYQTTAFFLERLGISSLDELPSLAPLLPDTSQLDDVALST